MAHHDETESDGADKLINAVMALLLLLAVGGLAAIADSAPKVPEVTAESFVLKPPVIDAARLAADRSKHYKSFDTTAAKTEIDALLGVVAEANKMQFSDESGAKTVHDAHVLTLHHANELIIAVGIDAYVAAGQPMFDQCSEGFDALLAAVRSGTITSDQASGDPGEPFDEYRKWCGKAYASLLQTGVVTADGNWGDATSGPLLFDIMNRFRWAAILDLRRPPSKSLSPYEFEALTRWRVSLSTVPVEKRVRWVVAAGGSLPQLPTEELIGSLLLEQGDAVGALGAYEDACKRDSNNLLLRKKCEYLRTIVREPAS